MLQEEGIKEREDLLEQISVLKSNIDDNEDIKKAKQRQLDRLSEDNDSLVEQINTYSSQLRIITKEKTKTEEDIKATKDALKALEEKLKLSKKAKDEIQKEKEILQEEGIKEKEDLLEQISVLKSYLQLSAQDYYERKDQD